MSWFRLPFTRRRSRRFDELSESIREHIEEKTEELMQDGMPREQAERAARREFGNVTRIAEKSREVWQWPTAESLWADIRFALRQLRRSPGFTLAALFTLALGTGANIAVFSLVNAVLLHPLPYRDPGGLMLVTESEPRQSQHLYGVAIQEARDYERLNRSFSQMGTFESSGFNLTDNGEPLRVNAALVSSSAFPMLGVSPVLGRGFSESEDQWGNGNVAVLSWRLWQIKYGGDKTILGRSIKLDETPYMVIGVMPPSFRFPFDGKPLSEMADLWVPDAIAPMRLDPGNRLMEFGVGLIGRLRPGVSAEQASQNMRQIAHAFQAEHKNDYSGALEVEPHTFAFASYSMQKARPLVALLMAAVACVLLIACANVANLLLARASHRVREMAIRSAVGASRTRLIRQCLIESLVLAVGGAGLGLAAAEALLSALRRWGPQSVPRLHDASIDPLVLLFTLALVVGTGILFGSVPAWKLAHPAPQGALKEMHAAGASRSSQRWLNAIAIAEVALAVVLLIGGGLLIRSFTRLMETPFGFDPRGTLVARTIFDRARYPDPARRIAVQHDLLNRLAHLPGVSSVAAASHLPLSDERQIGFRLEHSAPNDFHWAANSLVTPGYFRTMGIPLVEGRDFNDRDRSDTVPVAVVSQAFARQFLGGQSAVGSRFHWGDRALFTVIGVAADVHIAALDADPPPTIYNSIFQVESGATGRTALLLRGRDSSAAAFREIQSAVWSVDRDLPLYGTTSLADLAHESLDQRRFMLQLLNAFAISALALALIGLFGVLSYLVEQRERELGVRMALGADRSQILIMILRKGLALGAAGCAIGLLLSTLSTSLLRASLYRVDRFDPLTLAVVPVLLLLVTAVSVLIPARRAASIDPMQALRSE